MDNIITFLAAAVVAGTPLLFATLGEILTEKVGNLNLGVEGMMLMGSVIGFMAGLNTGNPILAMVAAAIAGAFGALIYAFLTISLRANQVVCGLTLTIFGTGFSSMVGKNLIGQVTPDKVKAFFVPVKIPLLSDIPFIGEIFFNHDRIASHRRLYGRSGQYSTVSEHMPEDHQKYLEWNGDRFRRWADQIGANTLKVVDLILTSGKIEQQSYRSCMGLLKLKDKYSSGRLEKACEKALSYSNHPSYKSIKNLLAAMKQSSEEALSEETAEQKPRGITRGAGYYGGNRS